MGSNFLSKVVVLSAVSGLLVSGVLPSVSDAATKAKTTAVKKTVKKTTAVKKTAVKAKVAPYNYAKYRTDMGNKIKKLKSDVTKRSRYFDGPVREVFDHDTYYEDTKITKSFDELSKMIVKYRAVMSTQYATVTALSKTLPKVNTATKKKAFDAAYTKASSRYAEKKYADMILIKGEDINMYIMDQHDESEAMYLANQKSQATPYVDFMNVHPLIKAQVNKSISVNAKGFVDRKVLSGMKKADAQKLANDISSRIKYTRYVGFAYGDVRYDQLMTKIYKRDFEYINTNRLGFLTLMPIALAKTDVAISNLFK